MPVPMRIRRTPRPIPPPPRRPAPVRRRCAGRTGNRAAPPAGAAAPWSCHRLAPYSRNRSSSSAGAEARPAAVLANSGKNATIVAQTTSATNGSPTQMMISGAIAGIGVTCSTTAQGWIAALRQPAGGHRQRHRHAQHRRDEQRGEGHHQGRGQRTAAIRAGRRRRRRRWRSGRAPGRPARRSGAPRPATRPARAGRTAPVRSGR